MGNRIFNMNVSERRWTLISIIVLIPVGFYTKFYSGILSIWVNNSLGGVLYVIFWSLIVYLLLPHYKPLSIAILVFLSTSILELLQLWHPYFLEFLRGYFLGRVILGTSFSWLDFFHYFIGFLLAVSFLKALKKIENQH